MALLALLVDVVTLVATVAPAIVLRNVIPTYFAEKAKNLATRENIEDISRKIEGVRAEYTSTAESLRTELRVAARGAANGSVRGFVGRDEPGRISRGKASIQPSTIPATRRHRS